MLKYITDDIEILLKRKILMKKIILKNKCLFKKVNLCLQNIDHLSLKQKRCIFEKLCLQYIKICIKLYTKFLLDKVV